MTVELQLFSIFRSHLEHEDASQSVVVKEYCIHISSHHSVTDQSSCRRRFPRRVATLWSLLSLSRARSVLLDPHFFSWRVYFSIVIIVNMLSIPPPLYPPPRPHCLRYFSTEFQTLLPDSDHGTRLSTQKMPGRTKERALDDGGNFPSYFHPLAPKTGSSVSVSSGSSCAFLPHKSTQYHLCTSGRSYHRQRKGGSQENLDVK